MAGCAELTKKDNLLYTGYDRINLLEVFSDEGVLKMTTFWQIAFITLIWGYTWAVIKIGLDYFPPFLFSTLRLMLGGFLLLIVLPFIHVPWKPEKKESEILIYYGPAHVYRIFWSAYLWHAVCKFGGDSCSGISHAHPG